MPLDAADLARLEANVLQDEQTRAEKAPTERQKLTSFTVACLILNRTIGSGIFVTPGRILKGTESIGISLVFWAVGAIVATCGLLVWLEFGRTIPRETVSNGEEKSVPRSGGEKNFLEYVFRKPLFLTTCMYGIVYIILGNLSGNAISLGQNLLIAVGRVPPGTSPNNGQVIAIAIAALTAACLLHVCSRRGGILVNDLFAILKVCILLAIIILGFIVAGGKNLGGEGSATANFSTKTSFARPRTDIVSYTDSFLYVFYAYSGFQQPFYVLAEVRRPSQNFARATLITMAMVAILFMLVNVSFFCVVPKEVQLASSDDMSVLFFRRVFGREVAARVMAGVIALSIFGNIIVMTFTASRVKQEIAKEGILPFSLFFASGTTTPYAWIKAKLRARREHKQWDPMQRQSYASSDEEKEQSPMAGLLLHWFSSIFLLAVTSMLKPAIAYNVLVQLYSYVIIVLVGFLTAVGLLYLKFNPRCRWRDLVSFRLGGWPTTIAAIVYSVVCAFLLITAFLEPRPDSPFSYAKTGFQWYIVPTIGISTLTWGVIWWLGLQTVMLSRGQQLVVTRKPHLVQEEEDGEWVLKSEIIDHAWQVPAPNWDDATSDEQIHHVPKP